jgi:putative membrane protein
MGGYGPGFGMMGGFGGGFFPFGGIFALLILALIIVGVAWFVRAMLRQREPHAERLSPGLDLLDQRYARGEINRDEYLQKRADVRG